MSLENEPGTSMREIVLQEIEEMKQLRMRRDQETMGRTYERSELEWLAYYLNNFPGRLLLSSGKSFDRLLSEWRNVDSSRHHKPRNIEEVRKAKLLRAGYTEKFLNQSLIEFEHEVDKAIDMSGVDREKLTEFMDSCLEKEGFPQRHAKSQPEILRELILPVFIALREMGYSHQDLH